ncbi:MAG: cell surface protein, partial [Planctomycetota bacterium]
IRHIQFAVRPEEDAKAIDAYLSSLTPVRGPAGNPAAIARGEKLFVKARCDKCHPAPLFTDLKSYDVGVGRGLDADRPLDTPTLVEIWRTAPYLYDGRAANLRSVLTTDNPDDRHGKTKDLTTEEIDDLVEFLQSL